MKEQILLFHFSDQKQVEAIQMAMALMQVPVKSVTKEEYLRRLKDLIEEKKESYLPYAGKELEENMLLIAGASGARMDSILALLRSTPACGTISLKAILTDTNQNWNVIQLYTELKRERQQMSSFS